MAAQIIAPKLGMSVTLLTMVEGSATPDRGWRFKIWSSEVADPESATNKVTIDSEKAVTANFTRTRTQRVGNRC